MVQSQILVKKSSQPSNAVATSRQNYIDKCKLAVKYAILRGVMERNSRVLDVGCRSPQAGLNHILRRQNNFNGQYVGIGPNVPAEHAARWNHANRIDPQGSPVSLIPMSLELTSAQVLAGKGLPFSPTQNHPFKEIAIAFCVNSLGNVRAKNELMMDLKRVAAQVVVVGGATESDMERWEFQFIAYIKDSENPTGPDEWFGVWLDDRALQRWRIKNAYPETVIGHFVASQGALPKRLGVCQHCGQTDYSGKSRFDCLKCGKENTVRNRKYRVKNA